MKNYKIYALVDPFTREIRYVGVTTRTLTQRLYAHKYEAKYSRNKNTYKNNWVSKIISSGELPIIILLENCDLENWEDREKFWISIFNNGRLTNQREGGTGVIVERSSYSIQRSANARKLPVVQLSINGEFIKEWDSASDAERELNIFRERIGKVCKHSAYTAGGFRWAFKSDYVDGIIPVYKTMSEVLTGRVIKALPVYLYDCRTGKYLERYESSVILAREHGYKYSSRVYSCINKRNILDGKYFVSTTKKEFYIPEDFRGIIVTFPDSRIFYYQNLESFRKEIFPSLRKYFFTEFSQGKHSFVYNHYTIQRYNKI